jgi:hypothetical protein
MGRKKLPITGPPFFPIKRGCKKFPHLIGAVSIRAGDLSALRHNRAEVPLFQYRPLPPLEMTMVADHLAEKRVIQKAVRNGYAFLHSLFSIEKSSPRGRAFSVLQASGAFAFLVRKY